jgi:hypothetical protein
MKNLNGFVVTSVVNNLINMSDEDLNSVAVLLSQYPNGDRLSALIGYAIQDLQIVESEMELV